jgi:predicted RNase H-like nuclease
LQDPGVTSVLGVDGCRVGWVGALVEGGRVSWHLFATIAEALALPVTAIGVDMPIGLPATGRRCCDVEAKALLGRAHPRVFLAPPRGVLDAATYEEAGRRHRELAGGLGLSVQTWHLVPKIREVDAVADDPRLVEVHPELSLAELGAAGPLPSKKTAAGRAARVALLTGWLGDLGDLPPGDDGLDALAVAWSAHRWLAGRARTLPGVPAYDEKGRPMRIVT